MFINPMAFPSGEKVTSTARSTGDVSYFEGQFVRLFRVIFRDQQISKWPILDLTVRFQSVLDLYLKNITRYLGLILGSSFAGPCHFEF